MIALLLLPLLAALAQAAPVADVAKQAAESVDRYCIDGTSGDVQIAANTLIPVGGVWAEVDEAWAASQEPSLLYWRARLAQCLEKDDRALADYTAFIEAMASDATYAQQVDDARRRVRFLQTSLAPPPATSGPSTATVAGAAIGIGLGSAAGVLGGLAGWQDATARAAVERYQGGSLTRDEFPGVAAEVERAGAAANALLGVSVGLGVSACVAAVFTAVLSPRPARSRGVALGPGGLEVRW